MSRVPLTLLITWLTQVPSLVVLITPSPPSRPNTTLPYRCIWSLRGRPPNYLPKHCRLVSLTPNIPGKLLLRLCMLTLWTLLLVVVKLTLHVPFPRAKFLVSTLPLSSLKELLANRDRLTPRKNRGTRSALTLLWNRGPILNDPIPLCILYGRPLTIGLPLARRTVLAHVPLILVVVLSTALVPGVALGARVRLSCCLNLVLTNPLLSFEKLLLVALSLEIFRGLGSATRLVGRLGTRGPVDLLT